MLRSRRVHDSLQVAVSQSCPTDDLVGEVPRLHYVACAAARLSQAGWSRAALESGRRPVQACAFLPTKENV